MKRCKDCKWSSRLCRMLREDFGGKCVGNYTPTGYAKFKGLLLTLLHALFMPKSALKSIGEDVHYQKELLFVNFNKWR